MEFVSDKRNSRPKLNNLLHCKCLINYWFILEVKSLAFGKWKMILMTLHVSVTINWEWTLIPSGFVCLFVLFGVVCLWGLPLLRGQGAVVGGDGSGRGFFTLKYVLLHLLPSFGFRLFRAIFILKTPPPNSLEEQNPFMREDGISMSIMIFSLAKTKTNSKVVFGCVRGTNRAVTSAQRWMVYC